MNETDRSNLDAKLHNWMLAVQHKQSEIRHLQDELLRSINPSDWAYASTCMAGLLTRIGAVNMTVNNFDTIGVAVTGGVVTGNVTGNAQTINQAPSLELMTAIQQLKAAILDSKELSLEQKEDQKLALADIEREVSKTESERNKSRVRVSLASIAQSVTVAKGLQGLYHVASTLILTHFGIALPTL